MEGGECRGQSGPLQKGTHYYLYKNIVFGHNMLIYKKTWNSNIFSDVSAGWRLASKCTVPSVRLAKFLSV